MATIGSFFAELGFKVNASQLKTANSTLKQINNAYKALTSEIKQQSLELKNQLIAERLSTQEMKTAAQASKAKESQMKAETAEIKRNIAEINLQNKSLKAHQKQLLDVSGAYNQIKRGIHGVFSGVTRGVYEGFNRIDRWTAQTRQAALEYRDFARQTGMSVETLQQYQAAGETVGSNLTSSQIAQDIKELQQRAQKIVYGKGDVSPYQMLGIVPNKRDAYEVLEGLRNRIDGLSDSAALMWIRNIGLSDDWLHILRMSSTEFNNIQKTMLSQDQIKKTTALAMVFRQIQFALKQLKDQMVAFIAEPLSNFISNFKTMTLDLATFLKTMTGSKEAFAIFATGLGLVVLAFSPVIAAIGALLLLWEDFYVGTHGGKSLFDWGDLDEYEKLIENIKTLTEDIQKTWNRVIDIIDSATKHIQGLYYFVKELRSMVGLGDKDNTAPQKDISIWEIGKEYFQNIKNSIGFRDKGYTPIGDNLYTPTEFKSKGVSVIIHDNKNINNEYNVNNTGEIAQIERNHNEGMYDDDILISGAAYEQLGGYGNDGELIKANKAMGGDRN